MRQHLYRDCLLVGVILVTVCTGGCQAKTSLTEDSLKILRAEMVATQIEAREVHNSIVLEAMRTVPRHKFVAKHLYPLAYSDHPLPIGAGQTISQPYIVAFMTEALRLQPHFRVLEIGTGSGYQAAVLAEIVDSVFTIEIIERLGKSARVTLSKLGYKNIQVRIGDGYQGWSEAAPFDAIIVTAAPPEVPQPLIDQLQVGGRMVIPVGEHFQELTRITKTEDEIIREKLLPVRFVPMTGEAQQH